MLEEKVRELADLPEVDLVSFTSFNPLFDAADLEAYGADLINWVGENRWLMADAYKFICRQRETVASQQSEEPGQRVEEYPVSVTEETAQANIQLDKQARECAMQSLISIPKRLTSMVMPAAPRLSLPLEEDEIIEKSDVVSTGTSRVSHHLSRHLSEEGEIPESELARNLAEVPFLGIFH